MKRWLYLLTFLAIFVGIQTWRSVRADDSQTPRICADGLSKFGKISCGGSSGDSYVEAYFLGASSVDEIAKKYPDRFEKLKANCLRKGMARGLASDSLQFKVDSVDACNGKRGYQEPCVKDDDCLERFCHPVRGTCSAVFTVPASFGN